MHIGWRDGFLDEAVDRVEKYLAARMPSSSLAHHRYRVPPTLDVVVPTYRCDLSILRAICTLPVVNDATTFHVIVDRPEELGRVREALEVLPRVRVRGNPVRVAGGDLPSPLLHI